MRSVIGAALVALSSAAIQLPPPSRTPPPASEAGLHPPPSDLHSAINNLGKFDDATRTAAAKTVRRAEPAQAVPALIDAASNHADGYVRFRALTEVNGNPWTSCAELNVIGI